MLGWPLPRLAKTRNAELINQVNKLADSVSYSVSNQSAKSKTSGAVKFAQTTV